MALLSSSSLNFDHFRVDFDQIPGQIAKNKSCFTNLCRVLSPKIDSTMMK